MHPLLKTILNLVLFLMCMSTVQAQTVWDAPQKYIEQNYEDVKIFIRAGQKEDELILTTYNELNKSIIKFSGTCQRVMGFDVQLSTHIMKDIAFKSPAYETDKTVKNLLLKKYVDATRLGIQSQCPNVEVIYIRFMGGGVYNQATIAKTQNWEIKDGIIEKEKLLINYDVNIDFFDSKLSYYGTTHFADCSKKAELTLKRSLKMPPWKKGSNPDLSIIELVGLAKRIIIEYKAQCNKIENIKFNLVGTNDEWFCPENTNCYLEADAKNDMQVKIIGYERNRALTENALIKSYDDVMKYLKIEDYKTLKQYPLVTELFYETFLVEYSKKFSNQIPNPKQREIVQISEQYDDLGYKVSENASVAVSVFIEAKYVTAFDRVFLSNQIAVKGIMFNRVIDARNKKDMSPVIGYIFDMLDDETSITNFLKDKSYNSSEVKTIYDNLYTLMH